MFLLIFRKLLHIHRPQLYLSLIQQKIRAQSIQSLTLINICYIACQFLNSSLFWCSKYNSFMLDNKIHHLQSLNHYNIFTNDRPARINYNNHYSHNIITHRQQPQHRINPEQKISFSSRKIIPLDTQVIRQRSEMIAHPSKLSPSVPGWFKGQTYKYYQRSNYNEITQKMNYSTLQPTPLNELVSKHVSNRSELGTPRSYTSNDSEVFYLGGPSRRQVYKARSSYKKPERQISGKIGTIEKRSFQLPKIPVKIGHSGYINTHKVW